ncbi:MAG TPA: hypothetical protein VGM05_29165 [Planctomycetaceae bacterium]|jgi:hypothetical protein
MERPELGTECFPQPRDDEPVSLRQDIADELADHLASSLRRHLLTSPTEDAARARVLVRFGNPQHVARQLWFDAMKEKIMSQRLNLVVSSLMAAVCLGVLGMVIVVFRDSQSLNAAMLERLHALATPAPAAPAAEPAAPAEWIRARFKLVQGQPGGPAAVGFNVQLQSGSHSQVVGETQKDGYMIYGTIEETSDADGIADLGMFRYGGYTLQVRAPWGESISRQVGLRPGQESIREIVCPAAAPDSVDVAFPVQWPDDLQNRNLCLLVQFGYSVTRHIGVDQWTSRSVTSRQVIPAQGMGGMGGSMAAPNPERDMLLLNANGELSKRLVRITKSHFANGTTVPEWVQFTPPARFDATISLPAATNWIAEIFVVDMSTEDDSSRAVLARSQNYYASFGGGMGGGMGGMGGGFFNVTDDDKVEKVHEGSGWSFEPRPGVINRWKIVLPDQLLDDVRASLKGEPKSDDEVVGRLKNSCDGTSKS